METNWRPCVITRFWQVPDQAYSEELDPVVTRQKLTRISHYPDRRFKSIRKYMIRNEPRNDDPARDDSVKRDSVYSEPGAVWTRSFPKIPGAAPRCQMRGGDACKPKNGSRWCPKRSSGLTRRKQRRTFQKSRKTVC